MGPVIVTDPNSKFAQEFNSENNDYKTEIAKYLVICKYSSLKTIFENISIIGYADPIQNHHIILFFMITDFVLASALLCAFLCYFPSDSRSEIFLASSSSFTQGDRIEPIERSSSWGLVWNNFTQVVR